MLGPFRQEMSVVVVVVMLMFAERMDHRWLSMV
jgi:hypothetical protein